MEMIESAIEHLSRFSTVLVASNSELRQSALIDMLDRRELSVLGPASTTDQAMILASHAGVDFAIIDLLSAADGSGSALADHLETTWGIPSLLLQPAA